MIRPLHSADCRRIAQIHVAARPGDFLPDLGVRFLTTLYSALLKRPGVLAFACEENQRVLGFTLGCIKTARTMRSVFLRSMVPLTCSATATCLRRPRLIPLAIETLRYPHRQKAQGPELLVIAVDPGAQGRGIGTRLVKTFTASLTIKGFTHCHVAVKAKNDLANRFYRSVGFTVIDRLEMYGEPWNVYEYVLAPTTTT